MAEPSRGLASWRDLLAEGRWSAFALICLGIWLNAADTLVTATVMPSVGEDLGGYAWFGWATAGFLLGSVVAGASAGWLSQRIGLRPAVVMAGLVLSVGCLISAAAPSMGWFLAGRVIQGVSGGWIAGFSYVAIALLFPERHLARVFATATAIWGVATLVGPLLGGLFAEAGAWRGVFWLFAGQAVAFAGGAAWLLRGAKPGVASGAGVPWPQLLVLTAGTLAIGFADRGGSVVAAAALVGAGLALLGLTLWLDRRASVRLLPRRAADLTGVIGAGYLALFALDAGTKGLAVYGPAILKTLHGLGPLEAGYVIAVEAAAWTMVALLVSGVDPRGDARLIRIGSATVLAGTAVAVFAMPGAHLGWVILCAALMGGGFGFGYASLNRQALAHLDDDERAVGASGLAAVRQTGSAVGAALCGVAANLAGLPRGLTPETATAAAWGVFGFAVPVTALGAWAAWRMAAQSTARGSVSVTRSPPSGASPSSTPPP